MLQQIQIIPDPATTQKAKGDFFEALICAAIEAQRYRVIRQINFTGTEIDLLCQHRDRPHETALIECKARSNIAAADIKSFAFDVLVTKRAKIGIFVHTSDLQHQASGMVEELRAEERLIFWGPDKTIEILQETGYICPPPTISDSHFLTATKRILLYSYHGHYWITLLSNKIVPTHYHVAAASDPRASIDDDTIKWISGLDDVKGLTRLESIFSGPAQRPTVAFDSVAEIQEAEQWDDYRPVGAKFFVGRNDVRHKLYQFVLTPMASTTGRRVFFVEGKSGWGKSSLLAELRARSRNRRNKNSFFVLAVDSRSANTGEFVSLAVAKLISMAAKGGFVPSRFSDINIASSFDILASSEMQALLGWLRVNKRVLVLSFDQFEDIFRKADLFRTFHKLMMDANDEQGNLIIGFSWKSEINIPIDNPAYGLWQQARDLAEHFRLGEFLGFEVDRVLKQLELVSHQVLPADLRRRLKDGSQGFPWLTKRLAIHCYHQLRGGVSPEELVDQNLNVGELMREDMEALSPDEARALQMVARRGYDGDPFDVAEIDDKVGESAIHSLLNKRLIVRSGGKYNVYWDIFRDFLVEGQVPILGESFLLRQFPGPCIATLEKLLERAPCKFADILKLSPGVKGGTALNRLRELRYLGVVTKVGDYYKVKSSIRSVNDFREFMHDRMAEHIVVRSLKRNPSDVITHTDVVASLNESFKGYGFGQKTWDIYAAYFMAWLRYAGVDFGRRLSDATRRTTGLAAFIPQWRPEKDCEVFLSFRGQPDKISRDNKMDKALYDLKALGLLAYDGPRVWITKRGLTILRQSDADARAEVARLALDLPKVRQAFETFDQTRGDAGGRFEDRLASTTLASIPSDSYRKVATSVLKSWARFIFEEINEPPLLWNKT